MSDKEYTRQWRAEHPDYDRKWREEHYITIQEIKKRFKKNHPDYDNEYRKKHLEACKDYVQNYRNSEKGKLNYKMRQRRYFKTEKGKLAAQRGRVQRRAREQKIINTLTVNEWLNILKEHNFKCFYCGIEFDENHTPEKDHIIPISKGGNNTKENIVPACKSCNSKKRNKTDIKALEYLKK